MYVCKKDIWDPPLHPQSHFCLVRLIAGAAMITTPLQQQLLSVLRQRSCDLYYSVSAFRENKRKNTTLAVLASVSVHLARSINSIQ